MPNKSLLVTILGFMGFCIGCFTLFNNCSGKKSQFHEVQYAPEEIAKGMLKDKKDLLVKDTVSLYDLKKSSLKKSGLYIDSINTIIARDSDLVGKIEKYSLRLSRPDSIRKTEIEFFLKSSISLDSLTRFDTLFVNDTSKLSVKKIPLKFSFYDSATEVGELHKATELTVSNFTSDVDLFSKYPGFGIWAFLIITFCCCFAMTIGFCINSGDELSVLTSSKLCNKAFSYSKSFWICLLLLGVFALVVYLTFYDTDAIKDLYFMKGLGKRIGSISILGYTTAAFCFAGMISTATYVKCFIEKIIATPDQKTIQQALNEEIAKLNELLKAETDITKQADLQSKIAVKNSELITSQALANTRLTAIENYKALKQLFRKFFYAIALLLALLVFCTGALYSAVDSMDFMKMVKSDLGFSPARHDFIYLYAALHTLLILLFYLPAQLVMDDYKDAVVVTTTSDEGTKTGFLSGLGVQVKKLTEVLLVGAPLVASFAQWLLNLIFEN
jgi:hypothetical protein